MRLGFLACMTCAAVIVSCGGSGSDPNSPPTKFSLVDAHYANCQTFMAYMPSDLRDEYEGKCDVLVTLRNDGGTNMGASEPEMRNTTSSLLIISGPGPAGSVCTIDLKVVAHGKTEDASCTVTWWLKDAPYNPNQQPSVIVLNP
jgi:hypothetical protein